MNFMELIFKADVSQLNDAKKALEDLGKEAPKTAEGVGDLTKGFDKLLGPLTLAIGAITAVTGVMVTMALAAIDNADKLDKLSTATGQSIADLEALAQHADKSGSSLESLQGIFDKIAIGLSKSSDENQRFAKALEYMGISTEKANGELKTQAELAQEAAQYWDQSSKSASDQAAIQLVLGNNYKQNIVALTSLNQVTEERNRLAELGAIADKNLAKASADFNDTVSDTSVVFKGMGNAIARELLPGLTGLARGFMDSATNGGIVKAAMTGVEAVAKTMGDALKLVALTVIGLDTTLAIAGKTLGAFAAIAVAALKFDTAGMKAIWKDLGDDIDKITDKATENIRKIQAGVKPGNPLEGPAVGVVNPNKLDLTRPDKPGKDKAAEEAERQRQEDIKGWIAYADFVFAEADQLNNDMAKINADFWKGQDKQKEEDIKGWIKYAEEVFKQAEEQDLALAKLHEERNRGERKAEEEKWKDFNRLVENYTQAAGDAFVEFALTGKNSFKDLISSMLVDLARLVMSEMFKTFLKNVGGGRGIVSAIGSFISAIGSFLMSANGAAFNQGGTRAFADGGVVSSPTMFNYAGGRGMMGEAGPEAILPLSRGSNGKLGVQVAGGGGGLVQNNNVTVNVQGGNTNAETGGTVSRAVMQAMQQIAKQEINNSRRPGGALNPMMI